MSNVSLVDGHIEEPKMTDEEIIKALECCAESTGAEACKGCPFSEKDTCDNEDNAPQKYALDLIKRKDAEIERLKEPKCVNIVHARSMGKTHSLYRAIYTEAIKEFAERLKCRSHRFKTIDRILVDCIPLDYIDNLVKEMVGD